jgi:two-component system response regulator GlrR
MANQASGLAYDKFVQDGDAAPMMQCVVATCIKHEALATQTVDALRALFKSRFALGLHVGSIVGICCDVLLPVVDCENYAQFVRDLAAQRRDHPECAIVVLGVGLSEEQLLGLLSLGILDFVVVPISACDLAVRLQRAAGLVPIKADTETRKAADPRLKELVGSSPVFSRQLAIVPQIAACDATVLLHGETGTGKELFARAIHSLSARATGPLITVNCGAIPTELMESELFGHLRGAFTTAHEARVGLIAEAEGGTLFLDEVDSLPHAAQIKLLRVLQEKEYRALGSNAIRRADVRIIAASNQNAAALAARGTMRQDLYFRLSVLTLTLPALRERREDIPALAFHFLRQYCKECKRPPMGITARALRELLAYEWPGNVRELKHVVERAVIMASARAAMIEHFGLAPDGLPGAAAESFSAAKARTVQTFERSYIEGLLRSCNGNVSRAARAAEKNRTAFFDLMRKHQIRPDRFRQPRAVAPNQAAG